MLKGERQVQPTITTIATDHKSRYQWIASKLDKDDVVLDACCGVGYGSYILSEPANKVYAFDIDQDAIDWAIKYYDSSKIHYYCRNFTEFWVGNSVFSKIVCFEAIEHVENPKLLLECFHDYLKPDGVLYISSPNQTIIPFSKDNFPFHNRHWTPKEFENMLGNCGFKVNAWYSQRDKRSTRFENHPFGRTMIAECGKI